MSSFAVVFVFSSQPSAFRYQLQRERPYFGSKNSQNAVFSGLSTGKRRPKTVRFCAQIAVFSEFMALFRPVFAVNWGPSARNLTPSPQNLAPSPYYRRWERMFVTRTGGLFWGNVVHDRLTSADVECGGSTPLCLSDMHSALRPGDGVSPVDKARSSPRTPYTAQLRVGGILPLRVEHTSIT